MARGEPPRPGSQLPAPYRNPWSTLAEALRAVLADQRLGLQRLWRRNREGELSVPGFWPRDLAPLFWPLLLALALALALVLGLGSRLLVVLRPLQSDQASPPAGVALSAERRPSPRGQTPAGADATAPPPAEPGRPLEPPAAVPVLAPEGPGAGRNPTAAGREKAGASARDTDVKAPEEAAGTAPGLRLDPLLELLSQGEDADLLLAARPDPAGSRLSLTLSEAAEALPQAELLAWAQRMQQRARDEGYERLELRDRQGRLRGRGALVGSGMILLAPVPDA